MKKETINQLYKAFEQYALEVNGVECWSRSCWVIAFGRTLPM